MQTRPLGNTGMNVTLLAFGGYPIGRPQTDHEAAKQAVWASLEGGMNMLDTSPHYGVGQSEILIGQALAERPDLNTCYISTKTGHYGEVFDYSYDHTFQSVETSLERMGRDSLDIVHIHDLRDASRFPEAMAGAHRALLELKEQGVVGNIGIGTDAMDVLQLALDSQGFDVLEVASRYNLINPQAASILTQAAANGIGIILASVYGSGILARGSASAGATYRYRPATDAIRHRVALLEELCARWDCKLTSAAVQFCLRGPAKDVIIALGAHRPEQVRANLQTIEPALPDGFWADLQPLLQDLEPEP